jgi:hypothetical protein
MTILFAHHTNHLAVAQHKAYTDVCSNLLHITISKPHPQTTQYNTKQTHYFLTFALFAGGFAGLPFVTFCGDFPSPLGAEDGFSLIDDVDGFVLDFALPGFLVLLFEVVLLFVDRADSLSDPPPPSRVPALPGFFFALLGFVLPLVGDLFPDLFVGDIIPPAVFDL